MKYFTGIDVSLRFVSICVIDEAGIVQHEMKVAAEVDAIVTSLRRFSPEIKELGLEAGTLTQYLTYGLQQAGYRSDLPGGAPDGNDTGSHAQQDRPQRCARAGADSAQWLVSASARQEPREPSSACTAASRKAILTKCIDLENELRGLLKIFGVRLASRVGHGSFDATARSAITADPLLARALVPLLDARTVLYQTYLKLDNAVKAVVRSDPICQRLMTVPGVGPVTSLTFKAGVDDAGRFRSSRTVAAHFGLTPRRFQSGETDNPGRISKAGDREVRLALYGAAHALMTRSDKWSTLKAWGLRLAKTRGHRRAVIAVARKLAVILHRMWVNGTDFRAARAQVA